MCCHSCMGDSRLWFSIYLFCLHVFFNATCGHNMYVMYVSFACMWSSMMHVNTICMLCGVKLLCVSAGGAAWVSTGPRATSRLYLKSCRSGSRQLHLRNLPNVGHFQCVGSVGHGSPSCLNGQYVLHPCHPSMLPRRVRLCATTVPAVTQTLILACCVVDRASYWSGMVTMLQWELTS